MWRTNCEQLAAFDEIVTSKEEEIASLKEQLRNQSSPSLSLNESGEEEDEAHVPPRPDRNSKQRRGKAPPIDSFTGESPEMRLDDWLPSLLRAADWNGWSKEELLIQLAGHLRGRALQEWNLLSKEKLSDFDATVKALRE